MASAASSTASSTVRTGRRYRILIHPQYYDCAQVPLLCARPHVPPCSHGAAAAGRRRAAALHVPRHRRFDGAAGPQAARASGLVWASGSMAAGAGRGDHAAACGGAAANRSPVCRPLEAPHVKTRELDRRTTRSLRRGCAAPVGRCGRAWRTGAGIGSYQPVVDRCPSAGQRRRSARRRAQSSAAPDGLTSPPGPPSARPWWLGAALRRARMRS